MPGTFRDKLARVRLRCDVNIFLAELSIALAIVAVAALAVVVAQQLFAVEPLAQKTPAFVFLALVAALLAFRWYRRRLSTMQVALLVDQRLTLKERFSTTLALESSHDLFAIAARDESYRALAGVAVDRCQPLHLTRRWLYTAGCWAAVALAAWLMPDYDLLGRRAEAAEAIAQAKALEQAKAEAKATLAKVEAAVNDAKAPGSLPEMADLKMAANGTTPEEVRRNAMVKLEDLATKLKTDLANNPQAQAAEAVKELMPGLRSPSPELRSAVRDMQQGKFGAAADKMRELAQAMQSGKMSEADKAKMADSLSNLAKQLQELAKNQQAMQDALAKAGLNKSAANMKPEDLKKLLEKQGLDPAKVAELMQKMQGCKSASQQCQSMSKALAQAAGQMGQPSGGAQAGMGQLSEMLDEMETANQQLAMAQAALDKTARAMGQLGDGQGEGEGLSYEELAGEGGKGEFSLGESDRRSRGSGGPGKGQGEVDVGDPEKVGHKPLRADNSSARQGPIIATWNVKEDQDRGEAKRDFAVAVQAAKDAAAEAITENRIPSKYQPAVKQYVKDAFQNVPDEAAPPPAAESSSAVQKAPAAEKVPAPEKK